MSLRAAAVAALALAASVEATTVHWAFGGKVLIEASVRSYDVDFGLVVFEQRFPHEVRPAKLRGGWSAEALHLSASTLFPAFARRAGPGDALACLSYDGIFPSMQASTVRDYKESWQGGQPLVIYDKAQAALPMLVFSALSSPKAQHMATGESFIGAGIKATVEIIPAGWTQQFILSAGTGINGGMMAWGDRMLRFTGKPRADLYRDDVISTIGFWTDNGGYYHYATGSDETYEEVLPKVKAYHDSLGIPFRHWQFDSWFYPKDGPVRPGGGGGAVTNWTAMPSVFPKGMAQIQSQLRVPTVMHNRQWSPHSDYIANLPFKWHKSPETAIPEDPPAFFEWFFKQQEGWGLAMYEQDWMCTEYNQTEALQTNISLADLWLYGMAAGAEGSGRTVQYCMPYAHDILSASAYPAVTNARATNDYFHAEHQWAIGATSIFYWALGIIPFKDGFYSSTHPQVGGQTVGPELHPDREAIMATLSGAMVGPMDGINLLNASRVLATCRKDGTILKPDRPVTTVDACFAAASDPAECFIYETFSDISALGRVHYLFMNDPTPLTPEMVYVTASDSYAVYNWYTGELLPLTSSVALAPGYEGHIYAVVSPIHSGWVFLGEVDKYVTSARLRFHSVVASGGGLSATVLGAAGEQVRVCAAKAQAPWAVVCKAVSFDTAGTKTVLFGEEDHLV